MKRLRHSVLFLLLMGVSSPLLAQNTGIPGVNLQYYRPAVDASGFLANYSPQMMKKGKYFLQVSQDFALKHMLQVAVNGVSYDIVDSVYTTDVVGSYAFADFLTAGVDIPIHAYARETNFNTLAGYTTSSMGDVMAALKFRLWEEGAKHPGLAFLVTTTFPTGDDTKFLGNGGVSPGATLIIGRKFKYASLAGNIGGVFSGSKNVLGVDFTSRLVYGTAVKVPFWFWDPLLSAMVELRGQVQPQDAQTITSPGGYSIGLRKEFKNGLIATVAGGAGWNNAIGNPRGRAIISLGYSPPSPKTPSKVELVEPIRPRPKRKRTILLRTHEKVAAPVVVEKAPTRSFLETLPKNSWLRKLLRS
jgi:hypothetical protein